MPRCGIFTVETLFAKKNLEIERCFVSFFRPGKDQQRFDAIRPP
jgi:hypothetical protein